MEPILQDGRQVGHAFGARVDHGRSRLLFARLRAGDGFAPDLDLGFRGLLLRLRSWRTYARRSIDGRRETEVTQAECAIVGALSGPGLGGAPSPGVSTLTVYAHASELSARHGPADAVLHAAARMEEARSCSDADGERLWRRILAAIAGRERDG